ncbi:MAG TPA: NADP-dependent oxidoreductase [Microlunatus sp.]|nr:NADP-dependent oxidoreductase [Microlunatus sp.]
MRATTYPAYSTDLSTLTVSEVPDPKVAPSSVLIKVRAAAVNPVDWKVMTGGLDGLMDAVFPIIPGWDVSGVVVALGHDTPEFSVGDEVFAYARKDVVHGGTFAEYVAVPAVSVAKKPATLSFEQAAGLPLAGGTALRSLDAVQARDGETVLVHAAAGGVGSFGVQIAVARGARVIGTASESNHHYLRSLGAEPVAYGDALVERVRNIAPHGVDAVVDFVGGQLKTTLAVLAQGGRHASIADPSVIQHGGRWIWVRPDGTETARLAGLADEGKLTVEVAETFGLDQVADAFRLSQSGHTRGKIIIAP